MRCCLCSKPEAIHGEQRRSGPNGELELWCFCPECWKELERQRAAQDSEICWRYVIFLKWICGGYTGLELPGEKSIDMPIRTGIRLPNAKKNNLEPRGGLNRPNEIPGNPRAPGRFHNDGRALPGLSAEGREVQEGKENLNPHGAGPEAAGTATGP